MRLLPVAAAVVLVLATSGCSIGVPFQPYMDGPEEVGTFATVEELKNAFVEAGGACPEWNQTDAVELAYQSGDCSGDTVLTIYDNQGNQDEAVAYLTEAMADIGGPTLLVGDLWMINTPEPEKYAEALGGEAVTGVQQ